MARVLIIDDSFEVVNALTVFLETAGYEVKNTTNAFEGLDIFADFEPDIVITDMLMPDMDGVEVIKAIRKAGSVIPIVAISGGGQKTLDSEYTLGLASAFGANASLSKPVDPVRLLEIISQYAG